MTSEAVRRLPWSHRVRVTIRGNMYMDARTIKAPGIKFEALSDLKGYLETSMSIVTYEASFIALLLARQFFLNFDLHLQSFVDIL